MFAFELVVCVLCLSGFAYLLSDALRMPYPQQFWDGPGAFPAVLSSLLVLMCLYWLVDTIIGHVHKSRISEADGPASEVIPSREEKREETKRLGIIIILTILYIMVLMPLITFPIATFVFLFITIKFFSGKGWLLPLTVSSVATLFIYAVFTYILFLPMPR
jgi:putative tricarboxylic transport membrane protein